MAQNPYDYMKPVSATGNQTQDLSQMMSSNMGMGGGIPPQLQGQITPDMLGLPQQGNPLLFQGMTGQQMQPQEELNALAGMPR